VDLSLKGKHALVCGASSGIGRATATELARLGASLTLLARREALLEQVARELEREGCPEALPLAADLDDHGSFVDRVRQHVSEHGPVHVLINNSGGPPGGAILDASARAFEETFSRHVLAAHELVRLVLPGMKGAGYGRIVNIISTSVREPIVNLGVSNTIRGAMASWAKTLSKELPPGVTINNVLPGYTETERLESLRQATATRLGKSVEQVNADWIATIPERRLGKPEEVAGVIAFLASPAASYLRGVSLAVDGGRMASI
jgi:3-oxoacyl-[acyl-carrier protein] reductase